jgi:uncharacterized membrane protein
MFPLVNSEPTPLELSFRVFSDGVVEVDYFIEVDPTEVAENFSLFGSNYENLLIFDQNNLPLDYAITNQVIEVQTFGALFLNVSYLTSDLTYKEGAIWSFSLNSPILSKILLPKDSTIIYLSDVPVNIGSYGSNPFVLMPEGSLDISYVIEFGDVERALTKINEVEAYLNRSKEQEIILSESETLLEQAKKAFMEESYIEAEILAEQAEEKTKIIIENAKKADEGIQQVEIEISKAYDEGRTNGIDLAEALLQQTKEAYAIGDYVLAFSLSEQAFDVAVKATRKENFLFFSTVGIIILLLAGSLIFKSYTERSTKRKQKNETVTYGLNAIFNENPDLRLDDREVIRFISDEGGEVFANEIRERFDIPRTSAWRMIRRLTTIGVLEERKVGGQSLVSINEYYIKSN